MSTIEKIMSRASSEGDVQKSADLKERETVLASEVVPEGTSMRGKPAGGVKKRDEKVVAQVRDWARGHGMDVDVNGHQRIMEEYRHIKRPLITNIDGFGDNHRMNANRIMVTSAVPGEGKTFTALNLAICLAAERGRSVILIDIDACRSPIPEYLGLPNEFGIIDFLDGATDRLEDVLYDTDIANLKVMLPGQTHHFFTELLRGTAMSNLFQEIERLYPNSIVVFDSPPLLASSEAATLARVVGQIVMVVRSGFTRKQDLREATIMIDPKKVTGYILNHVDHKHRSFSSDSYMYSV